MINLLQTISKPKNFYVKSNLLENRYITDGNIWTVDETIFNEETKLFLVVSLKTRAILGYIQAPNCKNEDLIIKLYKKILNDYQFTSLPCFVHSDTEEAYHSKEVQKFLAEKNIYISTTQGKNNQNQVSESINNRIKYLVTKILIEDTNKKAYRSFNKTLPMKLRLITKKVHKCQSKEYRKHLFESKFFKSQRQDVIQKAIIEYNKGNFSDGITREQAEYYDSFIGGFTINNTQLVKSDHIIAKKIKDDNITSIKRVQSKMLDILQTDLESEEKVAQILSLAFHRQDKTDKLVQQGFIGLSIQNAELLKNNQELKQELEQTRKETEKITKKLDKILQEQALAEQRKMKRKNRKRLAQRDPITEELYDYLIDRSLKIHKETYIGARLRLALALLTVTGVRISELLPIKANQIENLFLKSHIEIDRTKRGPASHKAYLTSLGKKLVNKRQQDFEILSAMKKLDSYIFTSEKNHYKPLRRDTLTKEVNSVLQNLAEKLPDKPNLTSHSFRVGFISQLWRDTNDIEFVRQAIGHAKIDTTCLKF